MMSCTILPLPKKLRQPCEPNIGTCVLERLRACATCARLSTTAALAGACMLQCSARARVLESGCQVCCTCTLAMIAVDHFSAAVESQPGVHRLALYRRTVTGRGLSKAVHRPKDEESFSS